MHIYVHIYVYYKHTCTCTLHILHTQNTHTRTLLHTCASYRPIHISYIYTCIYMHIARFTHTHKTHTHTHTQSLSLSLSLLHTCASSRPIPFSCHCEACAERARARERERFRKGERVERGGDNSSPSSPSIHSLFVNKSSSSFSSSSFPLCLLTDIHSLSLLLLLVPPE